ncbi:MAG: rhomboid family intramembrane serine protease, partial [Planctomycetes bacterium]|nr:rhomboid family intramembrane serine protease [Planctomycetota bacterium]
NLPMVERRLTQQLPSVESLSLSSRKILSQLKIRVAEEERYGLTSSKVRRLSSATKTLIGLNCIYFLVECYAGGSTNRETLERLGALSGNVINSGEWWRVVAASFMHAGVTHLLLNMLGLLILGPYLEFRLGIRRFVPFFLFTSIGAMGYCAAEMYFTNSDRMLVGASGFVMAIVGAIGAYMYYGWKFERSALARKNFTLIVIIVVLQLTVDASIPEISIQAHASGLVLGVVGIILLQLGTLFAPRGKDAPTTTSRDAT